MLAYLARRVLFAVFLVFAVSSAALLLVGMSSGDYASTELGLAASPAELEQLRARYGLDRPVPEQFFGWMARAARFDFGESMLYNRPVSQLIPERAINTAVLAVTALIAATLIGVPLGVISATRPRGLTTALIRGTSVALLSMPPLLTSLFLVFLAARTGWFPIGGMGGVGGAGEAERAGAAIIDFLWHLVVPSVALALPLAAMFERLQAQAMAETMGQPFVLATLARGVPYARVIWRDALKAALRPLLSVYGIIVGTLLSGSFAVEMITSWPGLGRLMLDALRARDLYLVAGCAATGSIFLAVGTLISDLALTAVDPRTQE